MKTKCVWLESCRACKSKLGVTKCGCAAPIFRLLRDMGAAKPRLTIEGRDVLVVTAAMGTMSSYAGAHIIHFFDILSKIDVKDVMAHYTVILDPRYSDLRVPRRRR